MKNRSWRRWIRNLLIGCGTFALIVAVFVVWIGVQIYQSTRPVTLTDHHPFKSAAKKERYLAHYDTRAKGWPVPSEEVFVETSWGQTFVRISGPVDAPPLVLLPGANATGLLFEPNVAHWAESYRVFAVDNIFDFGRSVHLRNFKTPEDFVDWVDELLDALGLDDGVHLLGLSYGGWIASQVALAHPERIQSLVLVAPAATVAWFSSDFIKYGVMCLIPHPHFTKRMVYWALEDAANGTPEQQRMVEDAAENAWLGLRSFKLKQMVHPTVLSDDELRRFAMPVLYLVGENERIYAVTAREAVARLNRVVPEIVTEVFPDCGHDISLVQAERFNRRVRDFLGRGAGCDVEASTADQATE